MTRTLQGFCRSLLDDGFPRRASDPEHVAGAFLRYFGIRGRPDLEGLEQLLGRAGFGEVTGRHLETMKGIHYSSPHGGYDIHYRQDLWDGAKEHTVLHEAYEIIHETLSDMASASRPERAVCPEADRFAAAVLMRREVFASFAEASGLDVVALQRMFRCSYASVGLRLAEVAQRRPLMVVLYERSERGDPSEWTGPAELRAVIVRRTPGFGAPRSPLLQGPRGGMPRPRRLPPPGSLAERAAETGEPHFGEDGVVSAVARPVVWKGHLAKVVVVAVPHADRSVLLAQRASCGLKSRRQASDVAARECEAVRRRGRRGDATAREDEGTHMPAGPKRAGHRIHAEPAEPGSPVKGYGGSR